MDERRRRVSWQDKPPPSSSNHDHSDSPTLSERKSHINSNVHRSRKTNKKQNIFSKLRNSILRKEKSSDKHTDDRDINGQSLKRSTSLDAGLQKRISQLISDENTESVGEGPELAIRESRIRRRRSFISSLIEGDLASPLAEDIQVEDSKATRSLNTTEEQDDLIEDSFSLFDNTITSMNSWEQSLSITKAFNCAWLPSTKKCRLFSGQLYILPNTAVLFQALRSNRLIRLRLRFRDILNISKGSWNNESNQALIIDLNRAKRITWIFVAWKATDLHEALDLIVCEWQRVLLNKLHSELDRRHAHFDMKYHRLIEQATAANASASSQHASTNWLDSLLSFLNFHKKTFESQKSSISSIEGRSLKNVYFERELPEIPPEIVAKIICGAATNFFRNFLGILGAIITDEKDSSTFSSISSYSLLMDFTDNGRIAKLIGKVSKWRIKQTFLILEPDFVVLDQFFAFEELAEFGFLVRYEVRRQCLENVSCLLTISGQLKETRLEDSARKRPVSLILRHSPSKVEEILQEYFRDEFLLQLLEFLEAKLDGFEEDYDTDGSDGVDEEIFYQNAIDNESKPLNSKQNFELLLTLLCLPNLYKFTHGRLGRILLRIFLGCLLVCSAATILYIFLPTHGPNLQSPRPKTDFTRFFLGELENETSDLLEIIHNLRKQINKSL